jgi:hypothetical protein
MKSGMSFHDSLLQVSKSLCRQRALISFGKSTEPTRAAHRGMEGIFDTAQELPGSTTVEVGTSVQTGIVPTG